MNDKESVPAVSSDTQDTDDEFDRLWESATDEALDEDPSEVAEAPALEAEAEPKPQALSGQTPEPEATPPAAEPEEDIETLEHKLKSAQGRYDKFGEQISDMEVRLEKKKAGG